MENQIEQIGQNIINEMSYDKNGIVYFTISGSARLVGVDKSNISRGVANEKSQLAKFLTKCGIKPLRLNMGENGIPDYVHALITKYYSQYAGRHCTELAQRADLYFSSIGVREWGKKVLGIDDNPKLPQNYAEALEELAETVREKENLKKEKKESQLLASQLIKINGKQTKENKEYKQCLKEVKRNSKQFGIDLSKPASEQIHEMSKLLQDLKTKLRGLKEDINKDGRHYTLTSVAKWCFVNSVDVPQGVKRWLSRYSKAVSLYCGVSFISKGEYDYKGNNKSDKTEFHPKVISFVHEYYQAGQDEQTIIEAFSKLDNSSMKDTLN